MKKSGVFIGNSAVWELEGGGDNQRRFPAISDDQTQICDADLRPERFELFEFELSFMPEGNVRCRSETGTN